MSINAGSAALTVEPVARCAEHSVLLLPQRACALQDQRFSPAVLGVVLAAHVAAWLGLMASEVRQPPQPPQPPPILISVIRPSAEPAKLAPPVAAPQPRRPQPARQAASIRPQPAPIPPEPTLAVPASMPQPAPDVAAAEVPQLPAEAPPVAEPAPPVAAAPVAAVADAAVEPLEQPRFDADYLDNPTPAYPRLSRRLGEQGRVLLRVQVSAVGAPTQVELHRSSGHARLDEVAAETVRRWKFAPARQGGKPVAAWVIVPIQFSLKG